jgi:eukaryotic-like serine/threonine-protein kinase
MRPSPRRSAGRHPDLPRLIGPLLPSFVLRHHLLWLRLTWQLPVPADLREELEQALGTAYSFERELGGGGMSRVFLASETALGRRVVIKVLPPEMGFAVSAERFKREVALAARLQHPHILPLLTAGERGRVLYYTMPFVDGESLRAKVTREGELPVAEAVRLLREIADALAYAHGEGVVHRDLKPENVLLSRGHAVVADFGVAKALQAAAQGHEPTSLTSVGVAIGTPMYMAPEQAAGDPSVDHRADLYALGCVAYELLTGAPPFAGRTPERTLAAQVSEAPEPLERRRPAVPPGLAVLVRQLLEKRPADRPQRAEDVVRALGEVSSEAHGAPVIASHRRVFIRAAVVAAGAGVLTLAAVLGYRVARHPVGRSDSAGTDAPSIAVLPFANLSDDRENEYFSDGMTEELNTALSKVRGLRVAASASAFALKNTRLSVPRIGDTLHVATVLEGSVRKAGSRVRISARLVNARDGYQLWTEEYDREVRDVFAVQDEIARAIVGALRPRLKLRSIADSTLVRSATTNVSAHDAYLRGRFLWNQRTFQSLGAAVTFFERAITQDSAYAQAYAGLADTYVILPAFGPAVPKDAYASAERAAQRALALDSTLPEAHNALAYARLLGEYDWQGAEREFRRAIELDPSYATAHAWYSDELVWLGRVREAVAEKELACSLDPLSRVVCLELARNLFIAGQYDDALRRLLTAVEADPSFARTYVVLCRVYLAKRALREAVGACDEGVRLSARESFAMGILAHAYAVAGDRARAEAVLRELEDRKRREYVSLLGIAIAHLGLGDTTAAVAWLDSAVTEHDPRALESIAEPIWGPLRADPRLARLRRRVGLGS